MPKTTRKSGAAGKKTCVKCGVVLTGRAWRYCDDCRPNRSNRKLVAETAAANGDHERAARILGRSAAGAELDVGAWGSLMLAGGLAVTSDVERARRMAGLPEMDPGELTQLETEARHRWAEVIDLRTEGFQRVAFLLAQQGMIQLLPRVGALPPNQIAPTVKSIVDALDKIQSGVAPSFGPFNLVVKVVRRAPASGD